jgi:hypothetical protein
MGVSINLAVEEQIVRGDSLTVMAEHIHRRRDNAYYIG